MLATESVSGYGPSPSPACVAVGACESGVRMEGEKLNIEKLAEANYASWSNEMQWSA